MGVIRLAAVEHFCDFSLSVSPPISGLRREISTNSENIFFPCLSDSKPCLFSVTAGDDDESEASCYSSTDSEPFLMDSPSDTISSSYVMSYRADDDNDDDNGSDSFLSYQEMDSEMIHSPSKLTLNLTEEGLLNLDTFLPTLAMSPDASGSISFFSGHSDL